ncbi:copper resistance protein CopC [Phytohabitans sp. ZYX-F-186]|uniref:Copper resistance protein CopC n=1 Tax=Phytohabitans maris TaxID=3071409 RepID=A0ABU0ZFL1_9ACTN|nr:copper resistance protein CopC [Phytohabitans sp. ZYX-F-186]MDQ7905211.1 copper resistance protein CopC [Phytohabitans sp. ZYX-F-186]
MPVAARRPPTRLAGLAGAVLCGLLIALGPAAPARAHAALLGTDPADGAVLPGPPAEVTLTFNEPVQVRGGAVRLLDAAGSEQPAQVRTVDTRVVISVPPGLGDGSYVVTWRVISADSHPVAGGLTFAIGAPTPTGVQAGAAAVPEPSRGVRLTRQVTEALGYAGVLASAGLAAFALLLLPRAGGSGTLVVRRRIYAVLRWSVPVTLAVLVVALPVVVAWQDGKGLDALAEPETWRTALTGDTTLTALLAAVGLAVTFLAVRATRSPTHPWYAPVAGAAAAALAVGSLALAGHTRTFGPAALVLCADLLHVTNAALWFGGLIGLTVLLLPSSQASASAAAAVVAGFSRIAAWLVAGLALTGVLLGWRIIRSWSALFGTAYGAALLVKVGLVAVIIAIAAWNRYRLVPRITPQQSAGPAWPVLRRTVRAEAGLLAAVLATTGVLVTQSPVRESTTPSAPPDHPASVELTARLGSHSAVVVLTPGTTGVNALQLNILDAGKRPVEPIAAPELSFSLPAQDVGPLERPVSRTAPGRYEAVAEFPLPGRWIIEVSVRTSKYENPIAQIPVEIP